ncbi:cell wall protein DAN4-like [Gambusia affinis]|uniref:cell wall protein DAN4-like n=1 Tax=Gambusia affinis TaxID=33528 RepID=UPI001CDB8DDE|nr:cell wall protein DAN4-like [Gambusia affinis]
MMMMKKIEMMEAKLWFALCALLLVNLGSADEAPNATTVQTPELTKSGNSVTHLPSMSTAASNFSSEAPKTGTNATNTTGPFSTSPPHTTQSTLNHTTPSHGTPPSATPSEELASNNSTQNETSPSTSVSAPKVATTTAAAAITASAFSTSPSNPTLSGDNATSQSSTNANQSIFATTKPSSVTITALLNITSTHAESSPKLTMEGSNSHDSPRPLLVGLVSAFIIAAIVITLLLFLKFRRRQNGPRFHRLQDLPMDDMMEETPLSMYSY